MILRDEFALLGKEIRQLAETWRALEVSVVEDRPPNDGLAVSDHLTEVVTDGTAEVRSALRAIEGRAGADSLHTTATALLRLRRRFDHEFRSHTAVSGLLRSVRGRGAEWRGWARSVRCGADRCAESLHGAEDAMLRCWREAVEVAELDRCGANR